MCLSGAIKIKLSYMKRVIEIKCSAGPVNKWFR